ncbi:AI-2E family transporter [Cellulomonas sp. URHB0016]
MSDLTSTSGSRPAAARKVAGARRNPNAYGIEHTAPRWLRSMAGVSWRLLVVVAAVGLIFYATSRVQLLFIALFLAFVFTAVLRPFVELLSRFMWRGLATALSILGGILFFVGLLTYVAYSIANQWQDLTEQFNDGIGQITDFLENGPLPFKITNEQIAQWFTNGQAWVQEHARRPGGPGGRGGGVGGRGLHRPGAGDLLHDLLPRARP